MSEAAGHWREPEGVPRGALTWLPPPKTGGLKTYIGVVDGKAVATIMRKPGGCVVHVPGWMWYPHSDAPDGKMGIKESPVIAFAGIKKAKQAVVEVMELLPVTA